MHGLIIVDKPKGWTSHDVILHLRKILGTKKIGHTGTLDPLATGVLLITIGQATRLFPFFCSLDKTYSGEIRLGIATETYDSEGHPLGPECFNFPSEKKLREAVKSFEGHITQLPPPFSAKKINGQAAFRLARKGLSPQLKPIKVTIHRFLILDYSPPLLKFEVECSSGTYIRTLAHDLGQRLGCGGHISQLRRLAVGYYTEEEAYPLEKIKEMVKKEQSARIIKPLETLLPHLPAIWLDEAGSKEFLHGSKITFERVARANLSPDQPKLVRLVIEKDTFRIFSSEGGLLGLATFIPENRYFQPRIVLKAS
ncbi:MAG: tRNA pseudouridine(55) synthase TruB [Candidatus Saccharicenans sp.]|nr:MAG: tRNA pseudouridine(55) synthase TruB [Candidatus Aminicenantes bacterium]HEK85973.1 tRNA pseudouridine(55) synthase TruB [Candidatus Aminicenantes bacterium]